MAICVHDSSKYRSGMRLCCGSHYRARLVPRLRHSSRHLREKRKDLQVGSQVLRVTDPFLRHVGIGWRMTIELVSHGSSRS